MKFYNRLWQNLRWFFCLLTFLHCSSGAVAFERFVRDPVTGLAIFGYDPVAYFDRHEAIKGSAKIEVEVKGAYWTFTSRANKERFKEAPKAYIPLFNGYGAMSVANGHLAEGNPLIWAIFNNRLILFHSVEARRAWALDPPRFLQAGEENWKSLQAGLSAQ